MYLNLLIILSIIIINLLIKISYVQGATGLQLASQGLARSLYTLFYTLIYIYLPCTTYLTHVVVFNYCSSSSLFFLLLICSSPSLSSPVLSSPPPLLSSNSHPKPPLPLPSSPPLFPSSPHLPTHSLTPSYHTYHTFCRHWASNLSKTRLKSR